MTDEYSKDELAFMQQQQRAASDSDPNSIYADSMREEKITNIISQINPDGLMIELEHRLRGDRKNPLTGSWENNNQKKVSENLVSNYVSYLGSILNQNTSLSNFTSTEINNLMSMIIDYVRDDLTDNAEIYGIKGNFDEMSRIGQVICTTCFAVFKRAQTGMEARRLFSALKVHETLTQKPKRSALEDFKFW